MRTRLLAPAFLVLFLVQALPAATLAWQNQQRLASGRPILLAVDTRDPRDLLRGEYSVLAYEIGRLQNAALATPPSEPACDLSRRPTCPLGPNRTVYARLAPDAEGVQRLRDVTFERPSREETFLVGTLRQGTLATRGARTGSGPECDRETCLTGQVSYGLETWYGPQGRPAKLDAARRGAVLVEARVAEDGTAILDAVRVNGTVFARTPRLW